MEVKQLSRLVPLGTVFRVFRAKVAATGGNASSASPDKFIRLLFSTSSHSNWTWTYVTASPLLLLCCNSSQRRAFGLIYGTTGMSPYNKTQSHYNCLPMRIQCLCTKTQRIAKEMGKHRQGKNHFLCFLQHLVQLIIEGCMNWGRHKPSTVQAWHAIA